MKERLLAVSERVLTWGAGLVAVLAFFGISKITDVSGPSWMTRKDLWIIGGVSVGVVAVQLVHFLRARQKPALVGESIRSRLVDARFIWHTTVKPDLGVWLVIEIFNSNDYSIVIDSIAWEVIDWTGQRFRGQAPVVHLTGTLDRKEFTLGPRCSDRIEIPDKKFDGLLHELLEAAKEVDPGTCWVSWTQIKWTIRIRGIGRDLLESETRFIEVTNRP